MKVTIYPHSTSKGDIRVNPYISDFIQTLEQNGMIIANPPHKNPLFSLIPQKTDSDAYIFTGWRMCRIINMEYYKPSLRSGSFSKSNCTTKK